MATTKRATINALLEHWNATGAPLVLIEGLDDEANLIDILDTLAKVGVPGAKEHASAARGATRNFSTYADAVNHAPSRQIRRAVQSRGQCEARLAADQVQGADFEKVRCELVDGHSDQHAFELKTADGLHKGWRRW